ncbi:hypothetical protein OHA40_23660 [Nocardia sp. NBC_00508]|uniref:hypothetical protein n=1 Tax=Nocardia sp. NBC_00508 TaxID=2975992 RepID=UPI002E81F743|nr:hypothetical protein [Nocardia sp. NBC_00508]WUD64665.1 hypothetical protein OHA40_23660 [Nocardia sp. NBC_00508]
MTVPCGVPADFDASMPQGPSTVTIVGSARPGHRSAARVDLRRATVSTSGYERIRLVADVIDAGSAATRRSWT